MSIRFIFVSAASALTLAACATQQENPFYKHSTNYKASSPYTTVASNEVAAQPTAVTYINETTSAYPTAQEAYTLPASSIQTSTSQTRIVNQCRMSAGVETCQAVEIPVTPQQVMPAQPAYEQTSNNGYLINASSVQSEGNLTQVESECVQAGAVVPCFPVEIPIAQSQATVSTPYYANAEVIMADSTSSDAQIVTSTDTHYNGTFSGTPGYHAMQSQSYEYLASDEVGTTPAPAPQNNFIEAAAPNANLFADQFVTNDGAMLHHVIEGDTLYSLARKTCTSVDAIQSMNNIDGNFTIRLGDNIRLPASRC